MTEKHFCVNERRIAVLETNSNWIRDNMITLTDKLDKIDDKLDKVIEQKADKTDFDKLENRYWIALSSAIGSMLLVVGFLLKTIFF